MKYYKFNYEGKNFELLTYSLNELPASSKQKAIQDHLNFLNEIGNEYENEAGKIVTEYDYLDCYNESHLAETAENIEANGYEYNIFGSIVPMTHFTGNHELSGKTAIRIDKKEIMLDLV